MHEGGGGGGAEGARQHASCGLPCFLAPSVQYYSDGFREIYSPSTHSFDRINPKPMVSKQNAGGAGRPFTTNHIFDAPTTFRHVESKSRRFKNFVGGS